MSKTTSIDEVLAGKRTWAVACCDVLEGLRAMPDCSVQCQVTSPPYYALRQYLFDGAVILRRDLSDDKRKEICDELASIGIAAHY